MNFRKFLNKTTWILAGLLVLVLIGLAIYQNQLMKRASREPSAENEATGEVSQSVVKSDTPADAETEKKNLIKQRIELQKRMLEDPSVRESVRSALEAQYKSLLETMALSPEQQQKLKDILTNSAMEYLELNPEVLAAVTDEDKAMLQKRYDNLRKETQMRAKALLGHDDYEKFQSFEDRTFPRTVVLGFAESLAPGDRLTEEQEKALIEIMYTEAQKVYADIGYDPTSLLEFPSDLNTETISKKMEITDRVLFNSADSSKDILPESLLKTYRDYLRNYSEQVEMSLVMLHQQYGE